MSEREQIIIELESGFPALSGFAFMAARKATLDSGESVLQSYQGVIYEVFPDGTRIERKRIEPPVTIANGTKVVIG